MMLIGASVSISTSGSLFLSLLNDVSGEDGSCGLAVYGILFFYKFK